MMTVLDKSRSGDSLQIPDTPLQSYAMNNFILWLNRVTYNEYDLIFFISVSFCHSSQSSSKGRSKQDAGREVMKRLKMFWGLQCGNPCLLNQFTLRGSAPLENRGIASKQMPAQRRHTGLCPQVCCHCAVHYSSKMVPPFSHTGSH